MGKLDKSKTKYKPTRNQLKWLKSALKPEIPPIISAIAEDCSVSRTQWYKWLDGVGRHKGFKEWWQEVWNASMNDAGWYLDKVGMQRAVKDYRYWEAMQMKYHKFKRQESVDIGVTDEIKNHLQSLTDKLKNEMDSNKSNNK